MSRISTIDSTGAHVLADAITRLERRGITVLLSGISATHDDVLVALGTAAHLRRDDLVFPDTPAAISAARDLLGTHHSVPDTPGACAAVTSPTALAAAPPARLPSHSPRH
jgi:SulP family sulfate permease